MGFFTDTPPPPGPAKPVDFETDLHLTILPAFSVSDARLPEFSRFLTAATGWFSPLRMVALKPEILGTVQKIPAWLVTTVGEEPEATVERLHCTVLDGLHSLGGRVFQEQFVGKGFTPHVSHWDGRGDLWLRHLTLVHHRGGFCKDMVNVGNYELSSLGVPEHI